VQVANWYLDLTILQEYWGKERTYHHTAPITMNYALREALRLVYEEGLERRYERHRKHAELLWQGLEDIGLELAVPASHRLPTLTTVLTPSDVDESLIRRGCFRISTLRLPVGLVLSEETFGGLA
jgi:alanine-glyoxylate transaminase/serine-glyoxylate transaminase/serine-pyruvate transaminase